MFESIRSDTESVHEDRSCTFEVLFQAYMGTLALRQFTIEQYLREAVIFNADNMTRPTMLKLHQGVVDDGKRSLSYKFGVGDVFLPCDTKNLS